MVSEVDYGLRGRMFASTSHLKTDHLTFPPVLHDWVIKDLGLVVSLRLRI